MRNHAHDDYDDVPTLRAGPPDDDELMPAHVVRNRQKAERGASTAPLWALLGASFIALVGLGWWSFQQISLMEQQLVATQESFARISEEAAGRLQAISGKVAASESTVTTGSEALKLQIRQLQQGVAGQTGDLGKRLEQVLADTREQQKAVTELQTQLQAQLKLVNGELAALKSSQVDGGKLDAQFKTLTTDVAALKAAQVDGGKLDTQLKSLGSDVAALKKQGNPSAAIQNLEQDMLVLKSQIDNRPAAAPSSSGASVQEFDAFRGQMTRSLNTLQSQVQNLQQQINARP
ncbi:MULTISPECIES: ATPase [Pseudomonas]|uniref:ATPase n=1 Tax=Pseudomonas capeferrum TaxID=1495066 RepID=A0ABY7R6E4_9PSED|nr:MULTISPECIES: ATPase [Pseudomonas]MUT50556.1 ATPase [Pseudomonas sp. TDA1]WCH99343.1 ATPase [Pseudomonas capeferrum]